MKKPWLEIVPGMLAFLLVLTTTCASAYGYVMNILKLIHLGSQDVMTVNLMAVLRVIGIFVAPLGALLGYF